MADGAKTTTHRSAAAAVARLASIGLLLICGFAAEKKGDLLMLLPLLTVFIFYLKSNPISHLIEKHHHFGGLCRRLPCCS